VNFLCPACRTPLPTAAPAVVACAQCGVEVDLTRVDTAPGQARLWPEVDLSGEQLGNFKLVARLGSGGMGTVYSAEGLTGRCAVKVLSPSMAADPGLRERFRREAKALHAVLHRGVVRIIEEGSQNGFCWYAMEHVEGSDLRARLAQGPMPPQEVEALARELLDALAAVHDAQLVHRDVKPANILLSPTGARLCDFGIAHFDAATTLTESAALLGSLRYMAPEQRAGQTSAKSDLYALGLVLHEALAKGLPGEAELPFSTPRRLKRLIEALLQTAPRLRPESAHAAAKMIALPKRGQVPAAVLVASAVLGVAVFGSWAVVGTQVKPPEPLPRLLNPPPPAAQQATSEPVAVPNAAEPVTEAPVDAGAIASAAPDAGTFVVAEAAQGYPLTVLTPPEVMGGLSKETVTAVLDRHLAELASCYETGLKANPDLAGDVTVRFMVRAPDAEGRTPPVLRFVLRGAKPMAEVAPRVSKKKKAATQEPTEEQSGDELPTEAPPKVTPTFGAVADLTVDRATLQNKLVLSCILKRVAGWRFPFPRKPALVSATWTFAPTGGEQRLTPLKQAPLVKAKALRDEVKPADKSAKRAGKGDPKDVNTKN
jgi:serine/threonine protein kinase